eukprot:TRINITY_DN15640_c0_g1_i2.p1 TRINITY_DN15640_c0_g1~~TRINITY_DN15640_c0_g1_i2.p1  ORF type:complete len:176 (-),score=9.21 TRINITY_DN15640_c0_g1_i2:183-710(-)
MLGKIAIRIKPHAIRHLFIRSLPTPNPSCWKFLPGKTLLPPNTSIEYNSVKDASSSLLARNLLLIEGICKVFYGPDFISITKTQDAEWDELKPEVLHAITDFFVTKTQPLVLTLPKEEKDEIEIVRKIKELIGERVSPLLHEDGGGIEYRGFDLNKGVMIAITIGCLCHTERSVC